MKKQPTLTDPEIQLCPFSTYEWLRKEAPVYKDPISGIYEVMRYEDVSNILADPVKFSNKSEQFNNLGTEAGKKSEKMLREEGVPPMLTLINNDPPEHRKLRSLLEKSFNIDSIKANEPMIADLANKLFDGFAHKGRIEFMSAFAIALPVEVITVMLGVSPNRMSDFRRWSDALLGLSVASPSEEQLLSDTRQVVEMQQFLKKEIAAVRQELAAGRPRKGFMTEMVQMKLDGEPLSTEWIVNMLQNLLVAGNETTSSGIGSAALRLASDLELQQRLRDNPELITSFIEEVLRLDTPLQCLYRKATQDVEIAGTVIPKGATIALRYGSANRDDKQFTSPEELNMKRPALRQHLTFGRGIHVCLGIVLARAELKIGIEILLKRLKNIRLDGDNAVERAPHFFGYGPRALRITFEAA